jgi:hypothetical protein
MLRQLTVAVSVVLGGPVWQRVERERHRHRHDDWVSGPDDWVSGGPDHDAHF